MKPVRLQRKRTKGSKLKSPNGLPIVYVGRPTKWGNPFAVAGIGNKTSVERFALHIGGFFDYAGIASLKEWLAPLKGKNLACFCKLSEPCHADILLDLANGYSGEKSK